MFKKSNTANENKTNIQLKSVKPNENVVEIKIEPSPGKLGVERLGPYGPNSFNENPKTNLTNPIVRNSTSTNNNKNSERVSKQHVTGLESAKANTNKSKSNIGSIKKLTESNTQSETKNHSKPNNENEESLSSKNPKKWIPNNGNETNQQLNDIFNNKPKSNNVKRENGTELECYNNLPKSGETFTMETSVKRLVEKYPMDQVQADEKEKSGMHNHLSSDKLAIKTDISNTDKDKSLTNQNAQQLYGIQGFNNSCYMDSTLFALFAFNNTLYNCLTISNPLSESLRKDVVEPLRKTRFVLKENMGKFRAHMAKIDLMYNNGSFMDAEDFLLTLFENSGIPPFFSYNNNSGVEYIHQIILSDSVFHETTKNLKLQDLIRDSFNLSDVKLETPPKDLFIVKMPVSNGILVISKPVIPDLTLDLSDIVVETENLKQGNHNKVSLSAVVCLRKNHFVAFVRKSYGHESPWVFMDSNPTTSQPEIVELEHLNYFLSNTDEMDENQSEKVKTEMRYYKRLIKDAYICIYDATNN